MGGAHAPVSPTSCHPPLASAIPHYAICTHPRPSTGFCPRRKRICTHLRIHRGHRDFARDRCWILEPLDLRYIIIYREPPIPRIATFLTSLTYFRLNTLHTNLWYDIVAVCTETFLYLSKEIKNLLHLWSDVQMYLLDCALIFQTARFRSNKDCLDWNFRGVCFSPCRVYPYTETLDFVRGKNFPVFRNLSWKRSCLPLIHFKTGLTSFLKSAVFGSTRDSVIRLL